MTNAQVSQRSAVTDRGPARLAIQRAWGPAAVAGFAVAAVAVVVAHNPYQGEATALSCPLFEYTGLLCPGCGGTRAVYSLAHGDVIQAWAMHPLLVLSIPLIAALWLRWTLRLHGVRLRPWRFPGWAGVVLATGIVIFAVLRNIEPFAPWLGPGPG